MRAEVREDVRARLQDWRIYLEIMKQVAQTRQFVLRWRGYRPGRDRRYVRFEVESAGGDPIPWEAVVRARGSRLHWIVPGDIGDGELPEDVSGRELGVLDSADPDKAQIRVELGADVLEQMTDVSSVLPSEGLIVYKAIGDLANIDRLGRGLERLQRGDCANPYLPLFVFDAAQARRLEPGQLRHLEDSDTLISELNAGQRSAVERALAAPDLMLIKGPPGTGKTTVIAELCYQVAREGGRVLISSVTNLAVDNALGKLVNHPAIRPLRLGREQSMEREGKLFMEASAPDLWLGRTADSCAKFWAAEQERVSQIERVLELRARIEEWKGDAMACLAREQALAKYEQQAEAVADYAAYLAFRPHMLALDSSVRSYAAAQLEAHQAAHCASDFAELLKLLRSVQDVLKSVRVGLLGVGVGADELLQAASAVGVVGAPGSQAGSQANLAESLLEREADGRLVPIGQWRSTLDGVSAGAGAPERWQAYGAEGAKRRLLQAWLAFGSLESVVRNEAARQQVAQRRRMGTTFGPSDSDAGGGDTAATPAMRKKALEESIASASSALASGGRGGGSTAWMRRIVNSAVCVLTGQADGGDQAEREWARDFAEARAYATRLSPSSCPTTCAAAELDQSDIEARAGQLASIIDGLKEEVGDLRSRLKSRVRMEIEAWGVSELMPDCMTEPAEERKPLSPDLFDCALERLNSLQAEMEEREEWSKRFSAIASDWMVRLAQRTPTEADALRSVYLDNANVIGATCSHVGSGEFLRRYPCFDMVIVDETSKCTPPELLLPMLVGGRIVVVGDDRQLHPMVESETLNEVAEQLGCGREQLDHLRRPIFREMWESARDDLRAMLTVQYRMHPSIMEAINQFYDDKLECGVVDPDTQRAHGCGGPRVPAGRHILWIDMLGEHRERAIGTTYVNEAEVEVVAAVLAELDAAWAHRVAEGAPPKDVGVITFYRAQEHELSQAFLSKAGLFPNLKLRIGTVDRFQGMERSIVVVSMVRNNSRGDIGFAKEPERVNVALSRARELLILVGRTELFCTRARSTSATQVYSRVADVVRRQGGYGYAHEFLGN